MKNKAQLDGMPVWFDGKSINEALFCEEFLQTHKIIFTNGAFFTPEGRVTDELPLRGEIFEELKCCAVSNIPRKISNIVELMKLAALVEDFPPEPDRIHLSNGTLFLDGTFVEGKPKIVRNRFPVSYNPNTPKPVLWLQFLDDLLYPEDIPTLQEYIGYCLIPSNKGQRMMVIKGSGGEGKSQIGAVLGTLFGSNMKDGSIGKISENRFARADLEHILLCVDDDMRMEALRQTNYVKSIVTAQGKMDLERKGKQSYQGWMCARLLAFSNGDLQALFDRSDGFYRRQLVLTTKEKQAGRVDDPDLAEKMKAEVEGSPPIGRARALSEGDCVSCGSRWTMPQPGRCCCHRPRSRFCGEMAKCHLTQFTVCLRKPATGSFTQIAGCNDSLHPTLGASRFTTYLLQKGVSNSSPPFRKDKVIYGNLPFGGQDGQSGCGALRRSRFGLSELFPDAQRV